MPDSATVLMIDDDREIVRGACLRLQAAGYRMTTAGDAEAGIAAALANHPDVILLDVRLPRRDGLSALSELKRRLETKHIPVVMLSASVVDQQAALDAGARFFLRKPYRGDMLVQAVRTALTTSDALCSIADTHPTGADSYDSPSESDRGF
jgi:DNA-binding response OmpR family regulator